MSAPFIFCYGRSMKTNEAGRETNDADAEKRYRIFPRINMANSTECKMATSALGCTESSTSKVQYIEKTPSLPLRR